MVSLPLKHMKKWVVLLPDLHALSENIYINYTLQIFEQKLFKLSKLNYIIELRGTNNNTSKAQLC